ncbi:MAG: ATP-binding cassette domain-containing protein [Egibacteraceae bacterium]
MSTTPALALCDVRKTYGTGEQQVVALDDVTLQVDDDEMVVLMGPSGSGKTTSWVTRSWSCCAAR